MLEQIPVNSAYLSAVLYFLHKLILAHRAENIKTDESLFSEASLRTLEMVS
jgi:hypothetical protein